MKVRIQPFPEKTHVLPETHKVSFKGLGPPFAPVLLIIKIQTGSDSDEWVFPSFLAPPSPKSLSISQVTKSKLSCAF